MRDPFTCGEPCTSCGKKCKGHFISHSHEGPYRCPKCLKLPLKGAN